VGRTLVRDDALTEPPQLFVRISVPVAADTVKMVIGDSPIKLLFPERIDDVDEVQILAEGNDASVFPPAAREVPMPPPAFSPRLRAPRPSA
jgi:hypothetical protein